MAEMQKLIKADLVLRISNPEKQKSHIECLKAQGFSVDLVADIVSDTQYVLLRCSFVGLCREAERMKLQMPLKNELAEKLESTCLSIETFLDDHLATDNEDDFISAPFVHCKGDKFHGFDNEHTFFRPSLRSLLVTVPLKGCLIPHAITLGASYSDNRSSSTSRNHSNRKTEVHNTSTKDNIAYSNDYEEYTDMEQKIKMKLSELMNFIQLTFDNDATPFFAMLVCIWGTLFLEFWKRKSATLAFEWDVKDLQVTEPDRPDYNEPDTSFLYVQVVVVVASVVGVVIYKITLRIDVCPGYNDQECLILTTVMSSFLNAISITILGKLYKYVAVWLTEKENHKSQSQHDDALIMKLFAFQFANSYSSCFYIAFMLERVDMSVVIGRGGNYRDTCLGTCMSQLTFQVIALMVAKSVIKFILDVVRPLVKQCYRWCKSNMTGPKQCETDIGTILRKEWEKPELDDFTLGEYTEKVIQYGYLMLFAASFPLAPLVAMVMNIVDLRVDGKRMLHVYRRPLAYVAKDIGIWYSILTFLNFVAVISNAYLVAFTSSWAQGCDLLAKVIIAVVFEHIVFVLKYILAFMIPDVPSSVNEAIRKEKDVHQRVFQSDNDGVEENTSSV
ncbi:anoctamin-7-like [Haliotis asinina]|uniref:anoctamin-7-like n=1 Tax=Haliotis asinina TaxID=109174 RepID=UPI003532326C